MEFHQFKNITESILCFKKAMRISKKIGNKKLYVMAADHLASMINHHRVGGSLDEAFSIWKKAREYAPNEFFSFDQPLAYHLRKKDLLKAQKAYQNSILKFAEKGTESGEMAAAILSLGYTALLQTLQQSEKTINIMLYLNKVITISGLDLTKWLVLFDLITNAIDEAGFTNFFKHLSFIEQTNKSINKPFILTIASLFTVLVEKDDNLPLSLQMMLQAKKEFKPKELNSLSYLVNPWEIWKDFNKNYIVH